MTSVQSVRSAGGGTRAKIILVFKVDKSMSKRISSVIYLAVILILLLPCPAWAWSGKVIGVADGDTITVLHDEKPQKIRLYGIDCPEKKQPFGKKAKQFTSDLLFGKDVDIEPVAIDRYGRTVAFVRVGSVNVNEELIKEGLAWVYLHYCKLPLCTDWQGLELTAQAEKRGLWGDSSHIAPWEYRRQKRKYKAPLVSLNAN